MNGRLRVLSLLAIRNVRRQARRSLLTASAMMLGVAVLVFSRALADGGHEDWIESGVRLGSGHVAFQTPRFRATSNIEDRLTASAAATAQEALGVPGVAEHVSNVAPRFEVQGLANSPTAAVPVAIVGVDPDLEAAFSELGDRVVEGRYLQAGDRLHAYVGARLADRLDLKVGSRLVLTAQDAQDEIAGQFVRVVGIFRSGLPVADERLVHIPIRTAQSWLGVGGDVTTVAVLLESGWIVPDVLQRLHDVLAGTTENLVVLGWREAMPQLDAAIKVDDLGDYVFNIILYAIITLAIVNTVLMSVLYRTREFGLLRALGLTKRQTAALVFGEGVFLTAVSGITGMVLGFAFTWVFFRNGLDFSFMLDNDFTFSGVVLEPVIVPTFRFAQVVRSLGAIAFVGVVASLYPAYRATRIDLAEAMKFEA